MIGIGATLGLVLGMALNFSFDLFWPLAALIAVSGILAYARLKTNSHKPSEVYTGFLMGAVVMFVLFYFI
jgi:phosphatidylserine synthase